MMWTTRPSSIVTRMPQLAWQKRQIAGVSVMRAGAFGQVPAPRGPDHPTSSKPS
jgi:hypothetical protein